MNHVIFLFPLVYEILFLILLYFNISSDLKVWMVLVLESCMFQTSHQTGFQKDYVIFFFLIRMLTRQILEEAWTLLVYLDVDQFAFPSPGFCLERLKAGGNAIVN